jgi:hypothetical protein
MRPQSEVVGFFYARHKRTIADPSSAPSTTSTTQHSSRLRGTAAANNKRRTKR